MSLKVVNDESCAAGESSTNGNRVIAERRGAVIVVREAVLKPHAQLCPNKKGPDTPVLGDKNTWEARMRVLTLCFSCLDAAA